jgi:hypothetical protein
LRYISYWVKHGGVSPRFALLWLHSNRRDAPALPRGRCFFQASFVLTSTFSFLCCLRLPSLSSCPSPSHRFGGLAPILCGDEVLRGFPVNKALPTDAHKRDFARLRRPIEGEPTDAQLAGNDRYQFVGSPIDDHCHPCHRF